MTVIHEISLGLYEYKKMPSIKKSRQGVEQPTIQWFAREDKLP